MSGATKALSLAKVAFCLAGFIGFTASVAQTQAPAGATKAIPSDEPILTPPARTPPVPPTAEQLAVRETHSSTAFDPNNFAARHKEVPPLLRETKKAGEATIAPPAQARPRQLGPEQLIGDHAQFPSEQPHGPVSRQLPELNPDNKPEATLSPPPMGH